MAQDSKDQTLADRIGVVSTQLATDLETGKSTRIEDLLVGWQRDERSELLRQLLAVEIGFRHAKQEELSVDEFVDRFPEDTSLVHIVFETPPATFDETLVYPGKTAPQDFGEYEVLNKIGEGGMGAVYKARHRRMDRIVAIKLLPPKSLDSPDAVKRFEREVKAAAKLEHQNVVTAYDAGEANGHHYLVMRYVDGQDLSAYVKQHGPLPVATAINYIAQTAHGLEYAHDEGIIHRDIKPSNLLLDRNGKVKILDLGLARLDSELDDNSATELTQSGTAMGTVDYMAPEQSADAHTADVRSDIYSLGCTFHYLLTGSAVYGGATLFNRMLAHRDQPIPALTEFRPDISPAVNHLFRKMVAKEPVDRYQTMAEVIEALHACGVGELPEHGSTTGCSFPTMQSAPPTFNGLAATATHVQPDAGESSPSETSISAINQQTVITAGDSAATSAPRNRKQLIAAAMAVVLLIGLLVSFNRRVETKNGVKVPTNEDEPVGDKPVNVMTDPSAQPRFAIAPFNAEQAKAHQEAWAKHLGVDVETTNSIGMKLRVIPPGKFTMGSPKEEIATLVAETKKRKETSNLRRWRSQGPQHQVTLTKPFAMSIHEVTRGQFRRFIEATSYKTDAEKSKVGGAGWKNGKVVWTRKFRWNTSLGFETEQTDDHPVVNVSWNDALAFCEWLSEKEGLKYRLPTEAEWEFSGRAGSLEKYCFGDEESLLSEYAWYDNHGGRNTRPVGQRMANALGLFDVHGNVREWCVDGRRAYGDRPVVDPVGPSQDSRAMLRGGQYRDEARGIHVSDRIDGHRAGNDCGIGFRIVRTFDKHNIGSTHVGHQPTTPTWKPGPTENVIAGIIPRPATIPGIRRWQLFTEHSIEWTPFPDSFNVVVWHPAGERFACTSGNNVRVYDANSRSLIQIFPHDGSSRTKNIAYSHDGKLLAAAYTDRTIRVWDGQNGKVQQEIAAGPYLNCISWSPDDQHLAVGSAMSESTVKWWSVHDGNERWRADIKSKTMSTAWSPDGKWFAAGSGDYLHIWSVADDMKVVLTLPTACQHVDWSHDGKHLSVVQGNKLSVLESETWNVIADRVARVSNQPRWDFHNQHVFFSYQHDLSSYSLGDQFVEQIGKTRRDPICLAPHPSEDLLVTQSSDGLLSYWTQKSGRWSNAEQPNVQQCEQLASSADGKWIVAWHPESRTNQIWDWDARLHDQLSSTSRFDINAEHVVASAEKNGIIRQVKLGTSASLTNLSNHFGAIDIIKYQPHGHELLSAGRKGTMRRYDCRSGEALQVIRDAGDIGHLSWRPDGNGFAILSNKDKTSHITIYSARGEILAKIDPPADDKIKGFRWHPNGFSIAVTLAKTVEIRSAAEQQVIAKTDEHVRGTFSTAWNPSGKLLATSGGDYDPTVRFWQEDGSPAGEMRADGTRIDEMKWSPDGKWLAARSSQSPYGIWMWNHEQHAPGPVFRHFGGDIRMCWHPDSKRLASTAGDGTMRIWNVESGQQEQITINLPESRSVTFDAAGNVMHGDRQTIEKSFKYLVEHADGKRELLKPSEFYRRTESRK